jgi:hypothetical protein
MRKLLLIATGLLGLALQAQAADKKLPFKGDIGMTYSQVIKAQGEPGEMSDHRYVYSNIKWRGLTGDLHYYFDDAAGDNYGLVFFIAYIPNNINKGRLLEDLRTIYIPLTKTALIKKAEESATSGLINEKQLEDYKRLYNDENRSYFNYKKYSIACSTDSNSGPRPYISYILKE